MATSDKPVDLSVLFNIPEVFRPLFTGAKRKNILKGGRGSGKSHQVGRYLLYRALTAKTLILCTRELQNTIADSVHSLLSRLIDDAHLNNVFRVKRDSIVAVNGSRFIFTGVRNNVNEIKSMEGVDIAWVEEAQAMSQHSLDILIPTIRKPGSQLVFTYNPFKEDDPIHQMALHPDEDTLVIEANYWDNPYFPDVLQSEMERDKVVDHDKYLWVWEGRCLGLSDALIFKNKYEEREFDTPSVAQFMFGADWGFAVDPTTLVRAFVIGNTLYVDYAVGDKGIDTEDIHDLFDTVPLSRKFPIRADNARPETISAVCKQGFYCIACDKKAGSIEDGVSYLRSFDKIVVHPRAHKLTYELERYQYKVDRQTGEVLRTPVDKWNHYIDALRYAIQTYMYQHHSGRVYDKFTTECLCRTPMVSDNELYLATYSLPGQTFAVGAQVFADGIHVVWCNEYKGLFDLRMIAKSLTGYVSNVTWFPLSDMYNTPADAVNACLELDWTPSIPAVTANGDEPTFLVNKEFENGTLHISIISAEAIVTALNERTFQSSAAVLETEQQTMQDMFVRYAQCLDYLVWRVQGLQLY